MASMWRKASLYLGLGPDDEYDEYDVVEEQAAPAPTPVQPRRDQVASVPRQGASQQAPQQVPPAAAQRPRQPRPRPQPPQSTMMPPAAPVDTEVSAVRPLPSPSSGETHQPKPRGSGVVRPVPAATTAKPHVVSPTSFNNAQEVADKFKNSQPVILNLREIDRDLSRRLIDFSSGLCYGLGGHMEKVANQVYLLTPLNIEVSAEERRRLSERGLHDA
jgi:cell division inhibitor SepF